MNLLETWSQIEAAGGAGLVARRLSPEVRHPLYAAVDLARNSRMLVLECKGSPSAAIHEALETTEGFSTKCLPLDISTTGRICLLIESTAQTPFDVFVSLCEDVARAVLKRTPAQDAVGVFADRLCLWKRLFENRGTGLLGYDARLGLLAELIHLRDVIHAGSNSSKIMQWWTGPDKLSTDFQSPHARTEVKATATRKQYKVRIQGERQLEPHDDRPLTLVAMMFERVVADGTSLPDLVASLKALLGSEGASSAFTAKLLEAGYFPIHEEAYQADRFLHLETREYRVESDFPRIRAAGIPNGVGDLQYSIELSACEAYRAPAGWAVRHLLGIGET